MMGVAVIVDMYGCTNTLVVLGRSLGTTLMGRQQMISREHLYRSVQMVLL